MQAKNKNPAAENPETFTGLQEGKIRKEAAGIPAVISALKKTFAVENSDSSN